MIIVTLIIIIIIIIITIFCTVFSSTQFSHLNPSITSGNHQWSGVTSGFAGVKLSGSLKIYGSFRVSVVNIIMVTANTRRSFTVK